MVAEGQARIVSPWRDLLLGEGTLFDLQDDFNPFIRQVRADQTGPRAWAHGSYSGAEWQSEIVVPVRFIANGADGDVASTRAAIQQVTAGFAAIGERRETVELRFWLDGDTTDYVMFGRTRGSEPDLSTLGAGYVFVSAAFVAQDPRVYSGTESTATTGLPVQQGGLTVPVTTPTVVEGSLLGGRISIVNDGTADAPLRVRIDGPAPNPGILLQRPDGTVQAARFNVTLTTGQWLDIDSTTGTALLNGLPGSNQRGSATVWDLDRYPILPGPNTLRFIASDYEAAAQAQAWWRSAWW